MFSGDKLLGGPQAGIIVGRKDLIAVLKAHPLLRAVRIDKLSLAALEATLMLYRDQDRLVASVPVLAMLAAPMPVLVRRARDLAALLGQIGGLDVEEADGRSYSGGGSLPETALPTRLVTIRAQGGIGGGLGTEELARRLRLHSALPAPSQFLPDPDLSGYVHRLLRPVADALSSGGFRAARALMPRPDFFALCGKLLKTAGGRLSIPRCLAPP